MKTVETKNMVVELSRNEKDDLLKALNIVNNLCKVMEANEYKNLEYNIFGLDRSISAEDLEATVAVLRAIRNIRKLSPDTGL